MDGPFAAKGDSVERSRDMTPGDDGERRPAPGDDAYSGADTAGETGAGTLAEASAEAGPDADADLTAAAATDAEAGADTRLGVEGSPPVAASDAPRGAPTADEPAWGATDGADGGSGAGGGTGLALAVMLGLVLLAVGALGLGGFLLMRNLSGADYSWEFDLGEWWGDDGGDAWVEEPWNDEPAEMPGEITDLTNLTAAPGDTYSPDGEVIQAGEAILPGIYVALDPEDSGDEGARCAWVVSQFDNAAEGGFYASATESAGDPMMLVPPGYWVRTSVSCGTWTAIDPDTAFEGATATTYAGGTAAVGRDIVPGTYLASAPGELGMSCSVTILDDFGFVGDGNYGDFFSSDTGSLVVDLEVGDVVQSYDCPTLESVDLDALVAQDAGATEVDAGDWLVGIDVVSGTYLGPAISGDEELCSAMAWPDHTGWKGNEEFAADVYYWGGEEPEPITVEPGQLLEIYECGPWERVGS